VPRTFIDGSSASQRDRGWLHLPRPSLDSLDGNVSKIWYTGRGLVRYLMYELARKRLGITRL
jgi:hypothetical protein